jgi:hypothetical protein
LPSSLEPAPPAEPLEPIDPATLVSRDEEQQDAVAEREAIEEEEGASPRQAKPTGEEARVLEVPKPRSHKGK